MSCHARLRHACLLIPIILFGYGCMAIADAQDTPPVEPQPMPDDVAADLESRVAALDAKTDEIERLEALNLAPDAPLQAVLDARMDRAVFGLLHDTVSFVKAVADARDAGYDTGRYSALASKKIGAIGKLGQLAWQRMRNKVKVSAADQSAAQQAAVNAYLLSAWQTGDDALDDYYAGLRLADSFGFDTSDDIERFTQMVADRGLNLSVFLDMSLEQVKGLRAGVRALPDDAELKAKLRVAQDRVRDTATALEDATRLMKTLGLDTSIYRQQLLAATGAVTTDVFDWQVISGLVASATRSVFDKFIDNGPTILFRVLLFFLIIYIFHKLAKLARSVAMRALTTSRFQLTQLLRHMVVTVIWNLVLILGILIALSQVGLSLGPLLAGLGIAGFVIGFALQDSLSNFASGLLILIYRPFDVGDYVEIGGTGGTVHNMSLVNTTVLTPDNQTVVMPNKLIWDGVIKNFSNQKLRRVDLKFGVAYTDDIPTVERILHEVIEAHDKVLKTPALNIRMAELGDSSVNFIARPWVVSGDYWDVYWDLTRAVKMRFDEEGISIPFPQRDVHLFGETDDQAREMTAAPPAGT